ncbi:PilL N-terminal domain-containing protein [Luteimonas sp. XNQY3]|nr:PilL N-terminal domain-containing protein [Luteimonas sp. XNQY3]
MLAAAGCTTPEERHPAALAAGSSGPVASARQEAAFVPVVRYGRYTLVELAPSAAQQDPLHQVIDVALPETAEATVGHALQHVLLRSGYRLCASQEVQALSALPLPAAHYRLGPVLLRDALLMLAGPGWDLQVDDRARRVCYLRASTPSSTASAKGSAPPVTTVARRGAIERAPLPDLTPP